VHSRTRCHTDLNLDPWCIYWRLTWSTHVLVCPYSYQYITRYILPRMMTNMKEGKWAAPLASQMGATPIWPLIWPHLEGGSDTAPQRPCSKGWTADDYWHDDSGWLITWRFLLWLCDMRRADIMTPPPMTVHEGQHIVGSTSASIRYVLCLQRIVILLFSFLKTQIRRGQS